MHLKRPDRFAGWLSQICRHLAIDTIRRRQIKTVDLAEANALPASAADTDNEGNEGVDQAIAGLPRLYREIVVLFYFHSMTYEELSQCLGISIHVVKGRLSRARKKLRAVLELEPRT